MKLINKVLTAATLGLVLMAGSCDDDAYIATENLKKAADNFEVQRRITFNNDFANEYLLEIEGLCSMDLNSGGTAFNVICKVGPNEYLRHTQVLSNFTSATVEQIEAATVSAYHYRITYKPQAIIPDIDLRGSMEELTSNKSEANQ